MLRGLPTVTHQTADLAAATQWYTELLGIDSYFDTPAHHPPRDFGGGFVGASVVDPFGNLLGSMYNPHHLEVMAARR